MPKIKLRRLKQILRLRKLLNKLNLNVPQVVLSQVPNGVLTGMFLRVMVHAALELPSPVVNLPIVAIINVVWELLNLTYEVVASVSAAWGLLSPET